MQWYCLFVFAYFLWAEPYVGESMTVAGRSLSAMVMVTWWAVAAVMAVRLAGRRHARLPLYWMVGAATCILLAVKCVLLAENSHMVFILSQSIGFFTMGMIAAAWRPSPRNYARWCMLISLGMLGFVVFANCVALGLYTPAGLQGVNDLTVGNTRFTGISDGAVCTVAVLWAVAACFASRNRWEHAIGAITILLAFSRLVSYGAKGLMACALSVILVALIVNFRGSMIRKRLVSLAGMGSLGIGCVVFLAGATGESVDTLQRYWDSFQARFESNDTLLARFDEASNDWEAFQDRPLLGWGSEVPGCNFLGEPSYGHFFATGTLARFGLLGTIGLAIAYVAYFGSTWRRIRGSSDRRARALLLGLLAWLPFFLLLGNPLYLFSPWSIMPLMLVAPRSRNRRSLAPPADGPAVASTAVASQISDCRPPA